MNRFCLISLMLCFSLCAEAQLKVVPRKVLESVNNPTLSTNAVALAFTTTFIAAEPMSEDDGVKEFIFPFENISEDTVFVSKLVSTCSCAVASCNRQTLSPGDKAEVVIRYNPKGHPGRFERKVFLYMDDDTSPSAVLRLSVNVERGTDLSGQYPIAMGNIRLRRAEVDFDKGQKAVERCVFVNVSGKPLRLQFEKAILPLWVSVKTEPEVVAPGEQGEIIVEYDPSVGGERRRTPIILKGMGVPPSQSTIIVTVNE